MLSSELQDWVKDIKNESEILEFKELICVKLYYIDCFFELFDDFGNKEVKKSPVNNEFKDIYKRL